MKKLWLFLSILFVGSLCYSQQKLNEKQVIEKSHIDFSTQIIYFVIHGQIEIDGHIFYNDTCKSPIIFQANLDNVSIVDTLTKVFYTHRHCDREKHGCKIIHLSVKNDNIFIQPQWRLWNGNNNIKLDVESDLTVPCVKP
jgi:hypothetical protein